MNDAFQFIPFVFFAGVIVVTIMWHVSRSRSILEQWAKKNGFVILKSDYRTFLRGPFLLWTSNVQTVHRVEVRDSSGRTRTGWVRCGGYFLGLWSDKVEVIWDDQP